LASGGDPTVRVVGAAILEADRCLVAQRGPKMSGAGKWEFPGGKIEPGETAAAALVREIAEELGLVVEVDERLGQSEVTAGGRRLKLEIFTARRLRGAPVAREHAALRWVTAAELDGLDWADADVPHLPAVRAALAPAARPRPEPR